LVFESSIVPKLFYDAYNNWKLSWCFLVISYLTTPVLSSTPCEKHTKKICVMIGLMEENFKNVPHKIATNFCDFEKFIENSHRVTGLTLIRNENTYQKLDFLYGHLWR